MTFNPNEQQQAIILSPIEEASRVLAGPGSGKTATTVHRISHLIEQGIDPDSILAVTFSKAMAEELGNRAFAANPNVNMRQVCTIHATCYRILREEGNKRDVADGKKGFLVKKFSREALDKVGLSEVPWKDFQAYVSGAKFNAIRHNGLPAYYAQHLNNNGGVNGSFVWKARAHEMLSQAHIEFDLAMQHSNLLTYADMLCEVEWLLADHADLLAKYQQRYRHLFVDEAQDTSRQAMRILSLLAAPQDYVMLIGDVDQTIYEFAGATPEANLWDGFEKRFPNGKTYMLETNYRSSQQIVAFTNKAIQPNYTDQTEQYRKTLKHRKDAPEGVEVTYDVYADPWAESEEVVKRIEAMIWDTDYTPGDHFVCARTRAQLPYLYGGLFRARIPFVDKSGGSFWNAAHVQDLLSYLKLSVDRSNDEAFQRIYNKASDQMKQPFDLRDRDSGNMIRPRGAYVNHRWLGKEFLNACGGSFWGMGSVNNFKWRDGMSDLRQFVGAIVNIPKAADRAQYIVDHCVLPWWQMEEGGDGSEADEGGRVDDLATVVDLASRYDTPEEFLNAINEMQEAIDQAQSGDDSAVVVLSTIHRLKGLERPVVHVIGVMDDILPHWSALGGSFASNSVLPMKDSNSLEAERRLFFVAVSRAKDIVFLTGPWTYRNKRLQRSHFAFETGLAEDVIQEAASKALEASAGDTSGPTVGNL